MKLFLLSAQLVHATGKLQHNNKQLLLLLLFPLRMLIDDVEDEFWMNEGRIAFVLVMQWARKFDKEFLHCRFICWVDQEPQQLAMTQSKMEIEWAENPSRNDVPSIFNYTKKNGENSHEWIENFATFVWRRNLFLDLPTLESLI